MASQMNSSTLEIDRNQGPSRLPACLLEDATPTMSTTMSQTIDLVYYKDAKASGLTIGAGLAFFFAVGVLCWSSLGTVCMLVSLHLITRLVYYNTVGERPTAPEVWFSEAEIQEHLTSLTARANALAQTAFALSCCKDNALTLQWAGGLLLLSLLCRVLGTTGLFFLLFVAAFSLPKVYELKQPEVDAAYAAARVKVLEVYKTGMSKVPSIPKAADLKEKESEKKKL